MMFLGSFSKFIVLMTISTLSYPVKCSSHNKSENVKVVDWNLAETKSYLFITIFILAVSIGKILYHKMYFISSYFPESFLLILFGLGAGAISRFAMNTTDISGLTPGLFFLILLPPIVLDSAYHMYNRTFGEILGIVIIFSVFGTVFCFLIIAFVLYGLEMIGAMGYIPPTNSNLMAILLFSSLIVAVDPVAVLAIFKDLGVDKELYYMIFGESLLNDAVTIVLYEIMKELIIIGSDGINVINILLGFASFFTVSFGGLLVGVIIGIFSSFLTRFQSNSSVHIVTMITSAYLSYILAYSLKWSGIISIIGCGIIQAAYAFKNLNRNSSKTLRNVVELIAGVSEAIIFVYLGFEVFDMDHVWNAGFQIWAIVMCIISRFIVILVLRFCINYARVDQRKISWTELFVGTYGGLRGAVAFSLVILIDPKILFKTDLSEGIRVRNLFVTTTLIIIIFTVSFMGTTMKPLARWLHVKTEKQKLLSLYTELNTAVIDNLMSAMEVLTGQRGRNQFRVFITNFDNNYIRSWLVKDPYDNSTFKIIKRYEQVSLALHSAGMSNKAADDHLCDVPKSLWPKPKLERIENIDKHVISNMRKRSQLVKHLNSTKFESKPDKVTKLLESTLTCRLNEIIRRKSTICQSTQRVQLPESVVELMPFENRWQLLESQIDIENKSKLSSTSFKDNQGFVSDQDQERSERFHSSKV